MIGYSSPIRSFGSFVRSHSGYMYAVPFIYFSCRLFAFGTAKDYHIKKIYEITQYTRTGANINTQKHRKHTQKGRAFFVVLCAFYFVRAEISFSACVFACSVNFSLSKYTRALACAGCVVSFAARFAKSSANCIA